jgi:hypothetical protein
MNACLKTNHCTCGDLYLKRNRTSDVLIEAALMLPGLYPVKNYSILVLLTDLTHLL